MSLKWESVILQNRAIHDLFDVADVGSRVLDRCEHAPKVSLHCMFSRDRLFSERFVSCEFAVFREKPLMLTDAESEAISKPVFGDSVLRFSHAEFLLAKSVSAKLGCRALFVYRNETYNSCGFALFSSGVLADFAFAGWEGESSVVSMSGEGAVTTTYVLRGIRQAMSGFEVSSFEDLFESFYSELSDVRSFLLSEGGRRLEKPREY